MYALPTTLLLPHSNQLFSYPYPPIFSFIVVRDLDFKPIIVLAVKLPDGCSGDGNTRTGSVL
jgi:hypothetical protein